VQAKPTRNRQPRLRGKSSTQEILGSINGNKVQRKWSEHQRNLFALREQFLKGRNAHSENAKEGLSTSTEHIADAATDSFDRDCALALLSSTQNALYEIEQALNRIANGTYGICEVTGQPIELDRLRAIPWTRFCTVAQSQLEARHRTGRVQLGEVGTCSKSSDSDESLDDDSDEVAVASGKAA
jgi:RNA polymerase-binding transcription factor DksA